MKKLLALLLFLIAGMSADVHANGLLSDLISYWKQDDVTGNSTDAHGSNTLTESGTSGDVAGIINRARSYSPSNTHSITDNASLSFADEDFSISCWVKLTGSVATRGVLGKYNSSASDRGYMVRYTASATNSFSFLAGSSDGSTFSQVDATTFGSASIDTWYHVVAVHDATADQISITVNGGTADTAAHSGGVHDDDQPFIIGKANTDEALGNIDEVAIWRRALSDTDIDNLYNSGSGLSYDSFTSSGDPNPLTPTLPGGTPDPLKRILP